MQPAFYEAFGLTVVESMTCGLPTFATCHGGPAEIIEDGVSGFHIDPYHPDRAATIMVDFYQKCKEDATYWNKISDGGLQRIYERSVELGSAKFLLPLSLGVTYLCKMSYFYWGSDGRKIRRNPLSLFSF